jgi:transcriptional regulator with XRE-family HTH domain
VADKILYGRQPGREVLREQGRTVAGVARRIDVNPQHLVQSLSGRIRPSTDVRNKLPAFLGVPLSELFTEEALATPGVKAFERKVYRWAS